MKPHSLQQDEPFTAEIFTEACESWANNTACFPSVWLGKGVSYESGMAQMRQAMLDVEACGPKLLFLEHEDIVTTTRQHQTKHLVTSKQALEVDGIRLFETDRGGDITFHGKGQLVGYTVMKLSRTKGPLDFVRVLERALTRVCLRLGVKNLTCLKGKTGVWVKKDTNYFEKLIAIGVGVSRGVTRHGFAFNLTTELERFTKHIVPCGLTDLGVTSLEREVHAELQKEEEIRQLICVELADLLELQTP